MCSASVGTATPTVQIENDAIRVTRWDFAKKGDNTGWHRHGHDYVVVPLFDGALDIKGPDGKITQAPMQMGVSYARQAGVEHDVINANDYPVAFVEIELLATNEES